VWVQTNVGRPPNNSASLPGRVHWRSVRYVFCRFFLCGRWGYLPFHPPRARAALCRPRSGGGRRRPPWRAPSSSPLTRLWLAFRLRIRVYCSNRLWRWCGPMAALHLPAVNLKFGPVRRPPAGLLRRRPLRRRRQRLPLRHLVPPALGRAPLLLSRLRGPTTRSLCRLALRLSPPVRRAPPSTKWVRGGPPGAPPRPGQPPHLRCLPIRGAWAHRCPPLLPGPAFCAVVPPPLPVVGCRRPPGPSIPPPLPPWHPRTLQGTRVLRHGRSSLAVAGAAAAARRRMRRRPPSGPRPLRLLLLACPGVGRPPPRRRPIQPPRFPPLLRALPLRSRH